MLDELKDFISEYPWIILVIAGILLMVIIIIVALLLLMKKSGGKNNSNMSFETLDEVTIDPGMRSVPVQPIKTAPIEPMFGEENLTRKLFPPQYPDMGLKSYQLEMYDLNMPGQVYRVNVTDRITIGRSHDCMISILNPTMSGHHCEIVLRNGKLYIQDTGSTNGTFLNGNPNRITEAELESGSTVKMGSAEYQVQISLVSM